MAIQFEDLKPGYYWAKKRDYGYFYDPNETFFVSTEEGSEYFIVCITGAFPFYNIKSIHGHLDKTDMIGLEITKRIEYPNDSATLS